MSLVHIPVGERITLEADLAVPENACALVIFSHGSGSSRFSPRNNFVAQQLQRSGIATLLVDLLTRQEDQFSSNRFDISLLSTRLVAITKWIIKNHEAGSLPVGYFGASTGAASALAAAVELPNRIKAIVSRGGRPDLAQVDLTLIKAPTLLIVGELDFDVMDLNRKVHDALHCEKKLVSIQGATHLFEEHGTLEQVADLAGEWFLKYLPAKQNPSQRLHSHFN